jgi:predicted Zn-dependent protease
MRGSKLTLIIGLIVAAMALFRYYSNTQVNEVTGEKQHIALTVDQEVAMGLQSAPQMAQEFGGLHPDMKAQAFVKEVGNKVVSQSSAATTPYKYNFYLLADPNTVNAFALPGGQIFITAALFSRLESEDQLAGVLGHEIGHVVARHSAERMAVEQRNQGLVSGLVIGSGGDMNTAQIAQVVAGTIGMKYGRDQELQADDLGVRFMYEAGYDPHALIGVMDILEKSTGGARVPEFQSTHPSPENRREKIKEAIIKYTGKQ